MKKLGLLYFLLVCLPMFAQRDLPLLGVGGPGGAGCSATAGHSYSYAFTTIESPLSNCSSWTAFAPLGWKNINVVSSGFAQGTQAGSGTFDDSTALLVGTWGNDQQVSVTAKTINRPTVLNSPDEEIEVRTRSTGASNNSTGYEFTFPSQATAANCAVQLNKWNGAVGSFTPVAACTNSGASFCYANGDTLTGRSIGTTHQIYINGVMMTTCTDATYASGQPGIGSFFWLNGGSGALTDFGQTSVRATDAPLVSKAHCSNDNSTGNTIACSVNTTGTGCMGVFVYWASTTATATVSGSTAGAFTSAVGPTTMLGTYRMQLFTKCGYTTNASDTITATISTSGIDHGIAVSAIQGVTALDQAPAINTGTSATGTSGTAVVGATDTYLLAACVFGGAYVGSLPGLPTRYFQLESASFGSNVFADGISTVNGSSQQFTASQSASNTFGCGIMSFK